MEGTVVQLPHQRQWKRWKNDRCSVWGYFHSPMTLISTAKNGSNENDCSLWIPWQTIVPQKNVKMNWMSQPVGVSELLMSLQNQNLPCGWNKGQGISWHLLVSTTDLKWWLRARLYFCCGSPACTKQYFLPCRNAGAGKLARCTQEPGMMWPLPKIPGTVLYKDMG